MDIKQIKELMAAMEKGGLRKLRVKEDAFEIELEKEPPPQTAALFIPPPRSDAPVFHTIAHEPRQEPPKKEPPAQTINSPLVGTFYPSPAPGKAHFVKVGDKVEEGTVVCIIEAMKVMNEVKAKVKGEIAEILIGEGKPVEFGTPLFRIV
jgi:acetyl-CoA carboxylase biotin carboxyl carrier protein